MNVPIVIARRYLFSKNNRNVINIISGIAALGVGIGSLAMIVVLSAFNGLEGLVSDLYTRVDPDLRVMPIKGKTFPMSPTELSELASWPEIEALTPVLEETVFLQYDDHQSIVTLRGIDEAYLPNLDLEGHVVEGSLGLNHRGVEAAFMGFGVADNLQLFIQDGMETIKVYAAKRDGISSMNPENKFVVEHIIPLGIVALNPEFDFKYFYTSYDFASKILNRRQEASYLEITALNPKVENQLREKLANRFGDNFEIKSRIELNDVIFKTNATEKWVTFFILSFIMIVATFTFIGSLSMLIIEKKRDIGLFRTMGLTIVGVRRLFVYEGLMITMVGIASGLSLGIALILAQQYIGFFPLQGGIVEFYPVSLELPDVLAVLCVSGLIGWGASLLPVSVLLKASNLQTMTS
ncbi:MAG: FtsX-like permease family protein [Flavobacteriales bacterium]